MLPVKEKVIENEILVYLESIGIDAIKVQKTGMYDPTKGRFRKQHSRFQPNGVSDIYWSCRKTKRSGWIEVKKPSEKKYIDKHYEELWKLRHSDKRKKRFQDQIIFIETRKLAGLLCGFAASIEDAKNIIGGNHDNQNI